MDVLFENNQSPSLTWPCLHAGIVDISLCEHVVAEGFKLLDRHALDGVLDDPDEALTTVIVVAPMCPGPKP